MIRFTFLIAISAFTIIQVLGNPRGPANETPCLGIQKRCYRDKQVGSPCRGALERWHFNRVTGECEQFIYGGCNGNPNRYRSESKCLRKCGNCPTESELRKSLSTNQSEGVLQWSIFGNRATPLETPTNLETPTVDDVKYYVHFASAAYCSNLDTWKCSECNLTGPNVELVKIMTTSILTGNLAFISINHAKPEIILTFRGTIKFGNLAEDIAIARIDSPYNDGVELHSGFDLSVRILYDQVLPILRSLHREYPNYRVVITGHSLGGAMASIALYYLAHDLPPTAQFALFTYGQPRSGNRAFADWINSQKMPAARVVNNFDAVPRLLELGILGYEHHLIEFWHFGGTTKICRKDVYEDPECSLSYPRLFGNLLDHISYFGSSFLGLNC